MAGCRPAAAGTAPGSRQAVAAFVPGQLGLEGPQGTADERTVPSGWLQAPRPIMSPAQRSTSARACRRGRGPASSARAAAIRGSPFRHGPHCPDDSAARYDTIRAVSARPHRSDGSAASTPADRGTALSQRAVIQGQADHVRHGSQQPW